MSPNQENIEEHLLLQYLLGNAGAEELPRIEAWLNESKENRNHLDRLERLWLETGKISPAPVAVDVEAAWQKMSSRINRSGSGRSARPKEGKLAMMTPFRYALSVAAVVVLFIGIYLLFRLINPPVRQLEMVSLQQVLRDTLPDGSRVILNENSKLTYPEAFEGKNREIRLSGEAYFEVAHDAAQPFIIDAGSAKIMVVGTAFLVKAIPGMEVEVNVTEGRVMLFTVNSTTGDTLSVFLNAGSKGILPLKSTQPVIAGERIPDDLFWVNHTLDFRGTYLSEVFRFLERYYQVTIAISDPAIKRCRLSATFANEPVDRILTVIAESFNLKLTISNQTYLLTGNGCSEGNEK